jgi:hypothetical protein
LQVFGSGGLFRLESFPDRSTEALDIRLAYQTSLLESLFCAWNQLECYFELLGIAKAQRAPAIIPRTNTPESQLSLCEDNSYIQLPKRRRAAVAYHHDNAGQQKHHNDPSEQISSYFD